MTSKQRRINADLIGSPLFTMAVGFDKLFNDIYDDPSFNANMQGYPHYDLNKITKRETGDVAYEIVIALAGFNESDITITVEQDHLNVVGNSSALYSDLDTEQYEVDYMHKGIAERNFRRTFKLAKNVEVRTAKLENGILRIQLESVVPEEQKPKTIQINR